MPRCQRVKGALTRGGDSECAVAHEGTVVEEVCCTAAPDRPWRSCSAAFTSSAPDCTAAAASSPQCRRPSRSAAARSSHSPCHTTIQCTLSEAGYCSSRCRRLQGSTKHAVLYTSLCTHPAIDVVHEVVGLGSRIMGHHVCGVPLLVSSHPQPGDSVPLRLGWRHSAGGAVPKRHRMRIVQACRLCAAIAY